MKKILLLLIFTYSCTLIFSQTQIVNVGTTANDGSGDPLRTAFQKVNLNTVATQDSFGVYRVLVNDRYTKSESVELVNDSLDQLRLDATPIGDIVSFPAITQHEIIDIVGITSVPTNIYYVSNDGNDTNDGLTSVTTWAHHPWMSTWTGSVTLVAGDMVCMKRGDTWTIATPAAAYMTVGQSGTAGNYIVTTAYGVGAKPIINISTNTNFPIIYALGKSYVIFDNLELTHYDYTAAVGDYSQSAFVVGKDVALNVPHDWIITNCTIHDMPYSGMYFYDDSYNITIGDIDATSAATTTSFSNYIYDCSYAGIQMYGCNPATDISNFKIYHNYINNMGITGGVNSYNITITATTQGANQWESHGYPSYYYIKYNRCSNNEVWEGIDSHGGTYGYVTDNYIYDCRFGIAIFANDDVGYPTPVCNNIYIERNTVVRGTAGSLYTKGIQVSSDDNSNRASTVYITDNIIYWETRAAQTGSIGINVFSIDGVTIDGNNIYNGPTTTSHGGIYVEGTGTQLIKNLTIKNNWIKDWNPGIEIYTEDIDGDIDIQNNTIYSHERCIYAHNGTLDAGTIAIYNNTLMSLYSGDNPKPIDFYVSVTIPVGTTLSIKNNILAISQTEGTNSVYILAPGTIAGTFECNYNNFWNSTSANPFVYLGGWHSFAEWQAHGFDANGLEASDPVFLNATTTYSADDDFILGNTSPCINVGTNVSIDYLGSAPDMGSKEKR